jgi:hypothetical protein
MTKEDQYLEIILQTNDWFDSKIGQLKLLIDKKSNSKILIEGKNGDKIELPDELKKGFHFGIQIAIEALGEFPVKIKNRK